MKRFVALLLPILVGSVLMPSCREESRITAPADSPRAPSSILADQGPPTGQWTPPFVWPIVAVHLQLLPNGNVLSFGQTGQPYEWNPKTGVFTERALPSHIFCGGHTLLADGRLMAIGGHITNDHGLPDANTFDFTSGRWTRIEDMAEGRWYPTATMLGNGDIVATAGANQSGAMVAVPEVWHEGQGWTALPTASKDLPYYPRMFLAPNGQLFYAGSGIATAYLDPTRALWTPVGNRLGPDREYGSAVMYEPGKVLYAGGNNRAPTNTAEVIDLNQGTPSWRFTGAMANAREYLNVTLLADGTVLATGGNTVGGHTTNGAVHAAELWDPATEQWRTLASNQITRVYHSTSILLPDARVLHAGSGDGGGLPKEFNAEIFSPPYLFNSDGTLASRPLITALPQSVGFGETFLVETPDAAEITKVTLLRPGAATHAFDQGQRFNRLDFTAVAGGLSVTAPADGNLAPPGYYMLFIIKGTGVPSEARFIKYGSASGGGGPPPAGAITATGGDGQTAMVNTPVAVSPSVRVTDAGGNPVEGVAVTFAASGGGSVTGGSATSNASGIAVVGSWTLGTTAGTGNNQVTATSAGFTGSPVTFTASATPGLVDPSASTATVPNGYVGNATTIVVQGRDQYGNSVTAGGATVAVTVSGANSAAPSVADNGNGTYGAAYTPSTAGTDQITITLNSTAIKNSPYSSTVTGGTGGGSGTIVLNAGDNQTATVGLNVALRPSVKVTDANSQPKAGVAVTFAVTRGGGSLTGAAQVTNTSGIATVGSWKLGTAAGSGNNQMTATSAGLTGGPVTFTASATPAPVKAAFSTATVPNGTVGTPTNILIQGKDKYENNVTTGGGSVVVKVTGANSATPVVTDNGNGTYGAAYTPSGAGTDQVAITLAGIAIKNSPYPSTVAGGTGGGGTPIIAVSAGNNQSATVNTAVATPPSIKLTDANGQPAANVAVTFKVTLGGGSITGFSRITGAGGIATVGSWTLGTKSGKNKLTATAAGFTGSPLVITATGTAGAPTGVIVNAGNNQTAPAGTALATKPSVKVTDAFNNGVPNLVVTFAVTSGGGSITGGTVKTGSAGAAAVGSWKLGVAPGVNTLRATVTGIGIAGNPLTFTATGF